MLWTRHLSCDINFISLPFSLMRKEAKNQEKITLYGSSLQLSCSVGTQFFGVLIESLNYALSIKVSTLFFALQSIKQKYNFDCILFEQSSLRRTERVYAIRPFSLFRFFFGEKRNEKILFKTLILMHFNTSM